jgi:biotin carboxyl carrier protein
MTLDGDDEPLVVKPNGRRPPAEATIFMLPETVDGASGRRRREVVVDGWRFEVEVEPESRARLRERAGRTTGRAGHVGRLEVRAVIPGRVLSVAIAAGDSVERGDRLLVVEAMKMQNDVRTPRAGRIARVAVGPGQTVELRDILVEIE